MRDENDIPVGGSGEVRRMVTPTASSIVGLGLGILSVILCWVPVVGIACGIIGLTAAFIGLTKVKSGFGIGAMVASIVGTILSIVFVVVELFGLMHFMN